MSKDDRQQRAQMRADEKDRRAQEKLAVSLSDLENYGTKVIEEACAGKLVRIYDKGYVRISGVLLKGNAPFEKLRGISSSADVTKKTGLGRFAAAVVTNGVSLMTSPNKRGDMYLTITTDKTTHMLHADPPTERDMKAMHKLTTAGQAVLDSVGALHVTPRATDSSVQPGPGSTASLADELTKLAALLSSGAINEDEFAELKRRLLSANMTDNSERDPSDLATSNESNVVGQTGLKTLVLLDAPKKSKVEIVRVIREHTGFGLREAMQIFDGTPAVVLSSADHNRVNILASLLRDRGANIELR